MDPRLVEEPPSCARCLASHSRPPPPPYRRGHSISSPGHIQNLLILILGSWKRLESLSLALRVIILTSAPQSLLAEDRAPVPYSPSSSSETAITLLA